jgi:hypothetical protein
MCAFDENKQGTAVVKPIKTCYYINRIEFNLIDFQSLTNGEFT